MNEIRKHTNSFGKKNNIRICSIGLNSIHFQLTFLLLPPPHLSPFSNWKGCAAKKFMLQNLMNSSWLKYSLKSNHKLNSLFIWFNILERDWYHFLIKMMVVFGRNYSMVSFFIQWILWKWCECKIYIRTAQKNKLLIPV